MKGKQKMNQAAETETSHTTEAAPVATQGAHVAPGKTTRASKASKNRVATAAKPKAAKANLKKNAAAAAKRARKSDTKEAAKTNGKKRAAAREGSKKEIVINLMRRKGGATLDEIMKETGWQAHSVRGFISGQLIKKMELPVASLKNAAGERYYRIEK